MIKGFLIFLFLGISLALQCQSDKLFAELDSIHVDSVNEAENVCKLLFKSINEEYKGREAYEKYNDAGLILYSKNLLSLANESFIYALDVANDIKDNELVARTQSNFGVINEIQGNYSLALEYYQLSLNSFIEVGDHKSQSLVYNNIAIIHQELCNNDAAYKNLEKSYELKTYINDSVLIASALNNFGVFYEENRIIPDSALYYYQKALEIYVALGDKSNEAICLNNIASVYSKLDNYEKAQEYFNSSVSLFRQKGEKLWLGKALLYLGRLENAYENHKEALDYLLEAKQYLFDYNYTNGMIEVVNELAKAYYSNGKYEESASEYILLDYLKDSLLNIDKQNEINELEIKFQTTQKQLQIDKLVHEQEIQKGKLRQIQLSAIGLGLILVLVIILLYIRGRHRKLLLLNKNIMIKQQLLQKQMNPHFLFNILASIQSYISKNESSKASSYLSKFSGLTRMVLQSSAQDKILLSEEIELLNNYIELEKLRMNEGFYFELIIQDNLEVDDIEIPPMMIQPFVENAIKHGVAKVNNGKLIIQIV
ncbi:MAG: hypothetical protein C0596_15195 [Marinilabiliales bacterium]|nr:MAG: hypothetical protein C0596_15195 [Marinilabiliales bacterium]